MPTEHSSSGEGIVYEPIAEKKPKSYVRIEIAEKHHTTAVDTKLNGKSHTALL